MKAYIQELETLCYYAGEPPGHWVKSVTDAAEFKTSSEAVLFAVQNQLHNVQIILRFNGSQYDAKFPL